MVDFLMISTRTTKKGIIEIYPKFIFKKSSDLMTRGGDFYAIWIEERGLWSTDENDAIILIDHELDSYYKENHDRLEGPARVLHLWDTDTGMIDKWHKYCQKQMPANSFTMLDERLIFSNTDVKKEDYASKRLPYPLEQGPIEGFDKLMSVLYSEEERHKIEWAIGSIVSGDSKSIQKFLVLYGAAGTGKSTVLNIIQKLFEGYYSVFDAKALGSSSNSFALEAFKTNPLVAIQHDGDLSKIEDNTRLNSLVSHEMMTVNEKFKSTYASRFKCFLFMGTNKPVKITDGRSGLIRRLIDVSPTGNKLNPKEYKSITKQIDFELGAIAYHCLQVYLKNTGYYDNYIPVTMMSASNDFYNFIIDSYYVFRKEDGTTLKAAWEMYNVYCDHAKITYPFTQRVFKEELKNYFWEFNERFSLDDGSRVRSYYSRFRTDKFEPEEIDIPQETNFLEFYQQKSNLDILYADCPAQYANKNESPCSKWDNVTSKLSDLDTSKLHYVKTPEQHIFVDFDIPDENGNKCLEKNIEAASKWPPTYAELSKSGQGIHLHYIYTGDVSQLSSVYDDHIEIKKCVGNASLRRKLFKCNNLKIQTITSGLPLKGDKKVVNFDAVKDEKELRNKIKKALRKEVHGDTTSNVHFIKKLLDDAYESGLKYDISDMASDITQFAGNSRNQSDHCLKLTLDMHFCSDEPSENVECNSDEFIFFDVEVFPNLFLINWKIAGEGRAVVRMINPKPAEIEDLIRHKLIGFNCRHYDNHMLYARLIGYTNEQLYELSQRIIVKKDKNAKFNEAYNLSYTDIYDFASAGNKMSLKKLEILMGITHKELGLRWDQPVPEERWIEVAEYCDNDVIATEAAFNYLYADWKTRQMLAEITDSSVNDSTNTLSARLIFGKEKNPQASFNYRNLGDMTVKTHTPILEVNGEIEVLDEFTRFDEKHQPIFPGYKFENGKSTYRGEVVGEGGYVYAEPGCHTNTSVSDVASMHPTSVRAERSLGDYTDNFSNIVDTRLAIKHGDFDTARKMFGGKLAKYLTDEKGADDLANALKTVINSVYGLTSAKFVNPFRDERNVDNIVAKRGALFMINLKHEVQKRGYTVVHIKTDSIKVADATPYILEFIRAYGELYGYTFEHECTYDRICLVNNAVYIAQYASVEKCELLYGSEYVHSSNDICKKNKKKPLKWDATGAQFAVPYVYKTLFSKEPILFEDTCETKQVSTSMYLDMNEYLPDVSVWEKVKALRASGKETKSAMKILSEFESFSDEEVEAEIAKGHNYIFIGRVGLFCPIKPHKGGGLLLREKETADGHLAFDSVAGTKSKTSNKIYRWMEADTVKVLHKENDVDKDYYRELVDEAIDVISSYTEKKSITFEQFASGAQIDLPWDTDDENDIFNKR